MLDDFFWFPLLVIAGLVTLFYVCYVLKDNRSETNFWRWLSIGLIGASLIYTLGFIAQRYPAYFLWSSAFAAALALISYFAHNRRLTSTGWLGLFILVSNGLFVVLSFFLHELSMLITGGLLLVVAVLCFMFYRQHRRYIANIVTLGIVLFGIMNLMINNHIIRSDLDYLNEVVLANYRQHYIETQEANESYTQAETQAEQCRTVIEDEFKTSTQNNIPYTDLVDEDIKQASESHNLALQGLAELPPRTDPFTSYSSSAEEAIKQDMSALEDAHYEANSALNNLQKVCETSRDLASSWTLTILWTEIGDYWSSEDYDSPDKRLCYYGEFYTIISTNYNVQNNQATPADTSTEQVIIDDSNGGDSEYTNWKVFRLADYERMVQDKWIPPIPNVNSATVTEEQVTEYLCGTNGILPEGTTFVKEQGSTVVEMEDMENLYVGDTRYGTWCKQNPDGTITTFEGENPPTTEQTEWCWYQEPGGDTGYYYTRTGSPGFYTYVRGPLRCVYCTPQSSWRGNAIVPDSTLSKINGTDASIYRRPSDIGGGPDSGK